MNKKEVIENKVKEILEEKNFLLIDFVWRGSEQQPVLEIFIDGEKSITVDDCYSVSRKLEQFIDEENILRKYRLDVSSPGVDRPLKYFKQYFKHIGRDFEVHFLEENNEKSFKGKLVEIKDDLLIFEKQGKMKEQIGINYSHIVKAKVLISF